MNTDHSLTTECILVTKDFQGFSTEIRLNMCTTENAFHLPTDYL